MFRPSEKSFSTWLNAVKDYEGAVAWAMHDVCIAAFKAKPTSYGIGMVRLPSNMSSQEIEKHNQSLRQPPDPAFMEKAVADIPVFWYPGEAAGTITLKERHGKTVLTHTVRYESGAARDIVLQPQTDGAWGCPRVRQVGVATCVKDRWKEKEMNNGSTNRATQPRSIGRSILALFAGFAAGVVLSLGTDLGLHAVGLWPSLGQPMSGQRYCSRRYIERSTESSAPTLSLDSRHFDPWSTH
jgi:hypothetical protein